MNRIWSYCKEGKNIFYKKENRIILLMILSLLILVLSLVPILYLMRYVHATGDDYGYGLYTHTAWITTHSFWEVFKAAIATIEKYYQGWQGTWFSIFLFSLQPEVFSPDAYWIVPILMVGLQILSFAKLIYYIMVHKLKYDKYSFLIILMSILFMNFQFLPSTKSGIFWFNGTAHYVVPLCICIFYFLQVLKYLENRKRKHIAVATIYAFFLGGASYLAALLALIITVLVLLLYLRKQYVKALLLPVIVELSGLIVSYLSPGNKIRAGQEFGFSLERIVKTILEAFDQGWNSILDYSLNKSIIFILFALSMLVVMNGIKIRKEAKKARHPILFICLTYCIYCSMFTPGIFAGTELSGGVPNTIYQVFLFMLFADGIYILEWLKWVISQRTLSGRTADIYLRLKNNINGYIYFPVVIVSFACMIYVRDQIKDISMYQCIEYISSGQAADYGKQMEERLAILLDTSIKDAKLPAMNQDQGPLMHMEITKDEEGWTNIVVRDFYHKNSVIEVDRN